MVPRQRPPAKSPWTCKRRIIRVLLVTKGVAIPRFKPDVDDSQLVLSAWIDTIVFSSNAVRAHWASRPRPNLR